MNPVVTFGELLLRLSPPDHAGLLESGGFRANWGGAEANVAVSLAHLGVPVRYVTALPDNPLGHAALAALRTEGVEVEAQLVPGGRLGLFFVDLGHDARPPATVYDRAHSAFSGIGGTSFDWRRLLSGARWLHLTGITPALGNGPASALHAAVAAARSLTLPVSLDLNYRPALWGDRDPKPSIAPLLASTELLIANQASLSAMLGQESEDPREVAETTGVPRVALTRRELLPGGVHRWSAALYDRPNNALETSRVRQVRAVDRVGGGDSFAAALIAQLLARRPPGQALEFAVAASAHKLTVPGDWSRLSAAEVEQLLKSPDPAWS